VTLFDKMSEFRTQLQTGIRKGIKKGWSSFVWICEIIVPVSFVAALIQGSGWLSQLDFLLHPLMSMINLPAAAALPIIVAMAVNLYVAITIMMILPFHKSGLNVIKAILVRIGAAVLSVFVTSQFFADTSQNISLPANLATYKLK